MLEAGTKAPAFTLKNDRDEDVRLSDFLGKKVVLYFYPRANTAGCSRQAQAFAAVYEEFLAMDVPVLAVSKDAQKALVKFREKYELPFTLLSDESHEVLEAYDVWKEKKLYGKVNMGTVRTTYVIDENGIIEKVWGKVKPDTNAEEVLSYLKEGN